MRCAQRCSIRTMPWSPSLCLLGKLLGRWPSVACTALLNPAAAFVAPMRAVSSFEKLVLCGGDQVESCDSGIDESCANTSKNSNLPIRSSVQVHPSIDGNALFCARDSCFRIRSSTQHDVVGVLPSASTHATSSMRSANSLPGAAEVCKNYGISLRARHQRHPVRSEVAPSLREADACLPSSLRMLRLKV
jgi:hypothetical protein